MTKDKAQLGVVGMAVMGRNLAFNVLDHGFRVAAFNRAAEPLDQAVAESGGRLLPARSPEQLLGMLERPRRVLLMIKAGAAVDQVLTTLIPMLETGDIVIDGGNSWYLDTQRREALCKNAGVLFCGMGVSGGEEGARNGPSLMPGGAREAYKALAPLLEGIAARTNSGPCVTHVGPGGSGHFVKMVHNGIEYADMQFIAEAYDVLAKVGGLKPERLAEVFDEWNQGPLESFLIEITSQVFRVRDPKTGGWLIDNVLDRAGQKGTGRWTAQVALDLGVPIPSIAAAIDARVLSSLKSDRGVASKVLQGPNPGRYSGSVPKLIDQVRDALFAAKVVAYAQGMHLIQAASKEYDWSIDMRELARIWKGGCIIRARFLDQMMKAYERRADLPHLLLDVDLREVVHARQAAWREVVALAQHHGIPTLGMATGLGYYDSYRTANLPQNLTQAQRDAFGAHTYQRSDAPDGPAVHTDWLGVHDTETTR